MCDDDRVGVCIIYMSAPPFSTAGERVWFSLNAVFFKGPESIVENESSKYVWNF